MLYFLIIIFFMQLVITYNTTSETMIKCKILRIHKRVSSMGTYRGKPTYYYCARCGKTLE